MGSWVHWDCSGTWTKAQKVKPDGREASKVHPQHKENTAIDASWVKFASGICSSEISVCLAFCTEQGSLLRSVPKALHMEPTALIYSILGLQFTPLLRVWSAGEARTEMCKLTLQCVKQRLDWGLCCWCTGLSVDSERDCSYLHSYSTKHLNTAATTIAHTGMKPGRSAVLLFFDHIMEKLSSIAFQAVKCHASSTVYLSAHDNFISPKL